MTKYKIKIASEALKDIQEATDWYNEQLQDLGSRFQKQVIVQINSLKDKPSSYAIRYADVRCMIIKKFPFMVHFITDENQKVVEVFAIYHRLAALPKSAGEEEREFMRSLVPD